MQIWLDAGYTPRTGEARLGIIIRQLVPGGTKETRLQLKTKAVDNNQAELKAIYYALQNIKGSPKREPIFIITDSKVAIECIKNPSNKKDKYRQIAECIRGMLYGENWRIYHKKAHTNNQDRYSIRQAMADKLTR